MQIENKKTIKNNFKINNIKNNFEIDTKEKIFYLALLFILPFFFSGSQIILGTLVNFIFLKIANKKYEKVWKIYSLIPSFSAILFSTLLFNLNYILIYLFVFIWIANYFFILKNNKNKIIESVIYKFSIIFIGTFIFYIMGILPIKILFVFLPNQIITMLFAIFCFKILKNTKLF